jgi:hypothetical protein
MPQRRWLHGLLLGSLTGLLALAGARAMADNEASEARLRRDITFLASDECEGRGPGTKGIDKAADYIANEFKKAGLKPGGSKGSYFQPFTISAGVSKLKGQGKLVLRGPQGQQIELTPDKDFTITGASASGSLKAPLVFAGHGVTAPRIDYDDYKGVDVADKIVVLLRRVPRWGNAEVPFDGQKKDDHAALVTKFANAESRRAAAVLLVNDSSEIPSKGDNLLGFGAPELRSVSLSIPILHVRRSALDPVLLSSLGSGLRELEQNISRDLTPCSAPLKGWSAHIEAPVERPTFAVKNVIGVLEGSGPLANETVVIGAHYDHLGYGGGFGSLAPPQDRGTKIHHGADDNGSGTTSVMELARRFAAMKDRKGRRLVFMTFSGEERGLLGSRYYCNQQPLFPLKDTVAMVNLDMVGRLSDETSKLLVEGLGTAKEFDKLVTELGEKHKFQLVKKQSGLGPSDHDSFCRKDIPVLFLWTGLHKDYHRPSDTSDKINVRGMRRIADMAEDIMVRIATEEERPQFVKAGAPTAGPVRGKGPRLGIQPNYEDEKEGVLIDAVTASGPADKAGMKAGDRIVEIGGRAVRNLNGLMVIMAQQERGRTVDIAVQRGGKRVTLKLTP